jgi:hypothetical protein
VTTATPWESIWVGHEVPQVVQSEPAGTGTSQVTDEGLGDPAGQPRRRFIGLGAEHEARVGGFDATWLGPGLGSASVFDEPFDVMSIATR